LAALAPADLGGIAVAIGPGMFTSLRVGVSMAKGLAMGLDLPMVGLPTLELAARAWTGLDREIVAVVAVGRGRVVWQRFAASGRAQGEPTNSSLDELRAAIAAGGPVIVAGEVPPSFEIEAIGSQAVRRGGDGGRRNPLILAAMGLERFRQHGPDDLVLLQPAYVHSRSGAVAGV
jgi:tRNA threonylcarbamoyladenosine biosynthesis protein TsaB